MIKEIKLTKKQKVFFAQFLKAINEATVGATLFVGRYEIAQEELRQQIKKEFPSLPLNNSAMPKFNHPKGEDWTITYQEKTTKGENQNV